MYLKLLLSDAFFQPKMHQIAFGGPDPLGELKRSPDLLAAIWGLLLMGREGGSRKRGEKRKGRGGRRREERVQGTAPLCGSYIRP